MGAMRDLWLKWKMLRLPWRKTFLVGQDLTGNTFWEFRDQLNPNRWRRIVKASPNRKNLHYSDVQISPQWHQWLRHARAATPTLEEQQQDLLRQAQLKHNAQLADARWAAKARYIEKPKAQERTMLSSDVRVDAGKETIEGDDSPAARKPNTGKDPVEDVLESAKERGEAPVPASSAGAGYQPEGWSPGVVRR